MQNFQECNKKADLSACLREFRREEVDLLLNCCVEWLRVAVALQPIKSLKHVVILQPPPVLSEPLIEAAHLHRIWSWHIAQHMIVQFPVDFVVNAISEEIPQLFRPAIIPVATLKQKMLVVPALCRCSMLSVSLSPVCCHCQHPLKRAKGFLPFPFSFTEHRADKKAVHSA